MAEVTGTASHQDLLQLRTDFATLQQAVQRSRMETEQLLAQADRRAREQASEQQRQSQPLNQRLDGLVSTLTTLSARLEEVSGRLDALERRLRAGAPAAPGTSAPAPATPRPVVPAPSASSPASPPAAPSAASPAPGVSVAPPGATTATPPAPVTAAPVVPPAVANVPPRPTTGALQPQDIYQAAYIDFSKGSYSLAIAGFREFLRRFPEHELADNAQYWIGEAYFSLARGFANATQPDRAAQALEQAVQEFKKVVANYPRGDKAPTALYKEGLALIEMKQPALAQVRFQYLVDNFPQAEETPLARERLAALKQ